MSLRRAAGAWRDLRRWIELARPGGLRPWGATRRCLRNSFVAGLGSLSALAVVSPGAFGRRTAGAFADDWPTLVLLGILGACLLWALLRRREIAWLARRLLDPFRRPMTEHDCYAGLVETLDSAPGAVRARFAVSYVHSPLVLAVLATAFSFSAAYFVVDAVLSRFAIGWGQPLLALANALVSALLWRAAVVRLSTWRVATSAHRAVTFGHHT